MYTSVANLFHSLSANEASRLSSYFAQFMVAIYYSNSGWIRRNINCLRMLSVTPTVDRINRLFTTEKSQKKPLRVAEYKSSKPRSASIISLSSDINFIIFPKLSIVRPSKKIMKIYICVVLNL